MRSAPTAWLEMMTSVVFPLFEAGYFLAAYSNAGMNSEDGNSIYKSRKRPATCLIAGRLQQCWLKTVQTGILFIDLVSDLPLTGD